MVFAFPDLLFAATTGVFADRLWSALLIDLPSMNPVTTWLRALLFIAGLSMLTVPYLVFRSSVAPHFFEWVRHHRSRKRPITYVI